MIRLALAALLALGLTALPARADEPCEPRSFEGNDYLVCSVDPATDGLELFWRDASGTPFRSFGTLARDLEAGGERLVFAMNAGMYEPDFTPMGLFVSEGDTEVDLNTARVEGNRPPNFFRRPNGVFFVSADGPGILTTEAFADRAPDVSLATQSGPMLVIAGDLHPDFIENSTDTRRRNGIGVCTDGRVKLAISERNVNFHEFARLFRDDLDCPDALYLDGGRGTGVYYPPLGRNDTSWHGGFGPMLGLVR